MFDYLLEKNIGIRKTLVEKFGFTDKDFTFMRECIVGPNEGCLNQDVRLIKEGLKKFTVSYGHRLP